MANLELVTYCGLYCGLCAQRNRIPQRATLLRDTMLKEGYENWGNKVPHFGEFWTFLNNLTASEPTCNCRGGRCGPPFCAIWKCVPQKGVKACPFCSEYPCAKVLGIARIRHHAGRRAAYEGNGHRCLDSGARRAETNRICLRGHPCSTIQHSRMNNVSRQVAPVRGKIRIGHPP